MLVNPSYRPTPPASPTPAAPAPAPDGLGGATSTGYQPPPYTGDAAGWIRKVRTDLGLIASQDNHAALQTIAQLAAKVGAPIQMDEVDSNGHLGGLIVNGVKQQLMDGNNNWVDPRPWPAENSAFAAPAIDPSYLSPFDQPYVASPDAKQPDAFSYPDFVAPGAFKAPTADSILQDPSYQFREGRLRGSIENSAAARGTLNSSGTIDALMNNVGNFASQEYGNIFDRDFNVWNTDYQHALTDYSTNRSNKSNIYDLAVGRSDTANNRAWQQYVEDKDSFYKNQSNPFQKLFQMSDLGLRAASASQ